MKSHQGITQDQETLEAVEAQLEELQLELEQQIEKISNDYDMIMENLEEVEIGASSGDITVHLLCLAWNPYKKDSNGFLTEA
ncbi:MAG: hypothetical protein GX201_06910 [Clostridiales bacterium]|nr:hypothetical protein [Clostridiales bacterium]